MRRVVLLSALVAPLLPGLASAQVTPEHAAALQDRIKGWFQSTLGADAGTPQVTVKAAGDHYDVSYPLSTGPDAPVMTGRMTDAGAGRWAVDDVTLPSPSVFRYQIPPTPPKKSGAAGTPGGEATTTLTTARQQQRMLIDPTLASPSTFTSSFGDLGLTTQLPGVTQLSHIDSATADTAVTPAGDGRLDITSNGEFNGYSVKMSGPVDPSSFSFSAGKATIASAFKGVSREGGTELLHVLAQMNRTVRAAQPGKAPPLDRATRIALLSALGNVLTSASIDQRFSDVTVTTEGKAGSLKLLDLGLQSQVNGGKLQARLPLIVEGLTLPPDLGLGDMVQFIPTRLTLTPSVSDLPSAAVMRFIRRAVDDQQPDNGDVAALFAQGPFGIGIDDFHLDVAGSSLAGKGALTISSPAMFSGTGQVTAENLDSLQRAMSAAPETAQVAPLLIFLKGIARNEQNRLVWDITYRDGRLVVNDQDMAALIGQPPPGAGAGAPPRPRPGTTRP